MKKILIVAFLLSVSSVCLFAQSKKQVAMVSFTGEKITASESQSLFNMFASELTRSEYSKDFTVLTRNESALRTAYGELKFQRDAMLNESQMSRVGQQLGADWVFYGTVTDFGGANVTINILDVESARIVASVSVRIPTVYDINAREMTRELIAKTRGTTFIATVQGTKEQEKLLDHYKTVKWIGRGLWIGGSVLTTVGIISMIHYGTTPYYDGVFGYWILGAACLGVGIPAILSGVPVDIIYSMRQKNIENEIKYGFVPYILPDTDINGQFNGKLNMGAQFAFSYKF